MSGRSRAVLVTGCSSGTGRATALRMHRSGWQVYATARKVEALDELAAAGIRVLALDVTDEASMQAAVDHISAEHGAVGALVNNAAYSLNGTFEQTPLGEVRQQFEANVFGVVRLTQLVLPGMRAQRYGRVVNVASFLAHFGTPGRGFYQATKHAVEALSDSLRLEVAGFGVRVVLIEPSPILGSFITRAATPGSQPDDGLYAGFWRRFEEWHKVYRDTAAPSGRARLAVRPEKVARVIEQAVASEHPRVRYRVGIPAQLLPRLRSVLPDRLFDAFVRSFFPAP